MKSVRILIPSIGHPTRPSLVRALRQNGEREVTVIGGDMDPAGIGPHVADEFVPLPSRAEDGYIERVLEICRERRIDVYYALGEEEAIASAERLSDFNAARVAVITPGSSEMLRIATDKAKYHAHLESLGLPHARYRAIHSYDEIVPALKALGYPDQDVFLKPARSKGGRGARLIAGRAGRERRIDPKAGDAPLQSLYEALISLKPAENKPFVPMIAMEHLPGRYFSVDVLSRNGEVRYAIPKVRMQGSASNTTIGQVELNQAAMDLAGRLCGAFGFSFLQNYEMKLDASGRPQVYDINPRGGTSLILCAAAGANIAYFAVKMALGEPVPQCPIRDGVRMLRYYEEYFQFPN